MAVFNLFSKRKATQAGRIPELQTERLPDKFRCQVAQLLRDTIGPWFHEPRHRSYALPRPSNEVWTSIFQAVTREHGRFTLGDANENLAGQCIQYWLNAEPDAALDLIEYALCFLDTVVRKSDLDQYEHLARVRPNVSAAIDEFNVRCRENGVGYQYADGRLVPASSTFIHAEVVEPALALLTDYGFRGPHEEFLNAFRHLRNGEPKLAVVEALKAFESTMKAVCARKGWRYDPAKATAKDLIALLLEKGHIPSYLQTQFAGLRSLLESGVPTVRNKNGAHGQGPDPVEVPRPLAEYAIHLTAANIVFLVKMV